MAERNSLLNCRTGNGTEGSNPSSSAEREKSPNKGLFYVKSHSGDKIGTQLNRHKFMSKKYKFAKLYKGKGGDASEKWFVYYSYIDPATLRFQRIRVYEGINEIKDLKEKEKFGDELVSEINKTLKAGYDPFETDESGEVIIKEVQSEIERVENPPFPLITEGFIEFLNEKRRNDLAKPTIQSYEGKIGMFEYYLLENKMADLRVDAIDSLFVSNMLEWLRPVQKWNPTTFNNHLSMWAMLIKWFAKKPRFWVNPEVFDLGKDGDIQFKNSSPMKHQYFGDPVGPRVREELKKFPKLEQFCMFIYFSCMRPDEIRNLKIENVDMAGRYIKIVGKTKSRTVPICDELFDILNSLNIDKHPLNYYVIGKEGEVSPHMHSENWYTKTFREEIRKPLGISENFSPYGWKHTRVVDLLNAKYSDAEVMNLTGHRDTAGYDKYKRDLIGHLETRLRGKTIGWSRNKTE